MAALVLAVVAAYLADKLLDWAAAGATACGLASGREGLMCIWE
jgi:hypothetical protein